MLVAELVPEVMEVFIMRTEDYVAESGSSSLAIWQSQDREPHYSCSIVSVTSSIGRN